MRQHLLSRAPLAHLESQPDASTFQGRAFLGALNHRKLKAPVSIGWICLSLRISSSRNALAWSSDPKYSIFSTTRTLTILDSAATALSRCPAQTTSRLQHSAKLDQHATLRMTRERFSLR